MNKQQAIADIYMCALTLATLANSAGDMNTTQVSANLQQANRQLQEALRMYEFVR